MQHKLFQQNTVYSNLFIYQASGVQPGPSRASASPVSTENVIYETIAFFKWEIGWCFFYCLPGGKGEVSKSWKDDEMTCLYLFVFSMEEMKRNSILVFHQNKGFINYVFCRNWGVRNPAGTRLDTSSLVNKQVVYKRQKIYPSPKNCTPNKLL